jgi:hypothetical protein
MMGNKRNLCPYIERSFDVHTTAAQEIPVAVDAAGRNVHIIQNTTVSQSGGICCSFSFSHRCLDLTGGGRRVRRGIISRGSSSEAHHYGSNRYACLAGYK